MILSDRKFNVNKSEKEGNAFRIEKFRKLGVVYCKNFKDVIMICCFLFLVFNFVFFGMVRFLDRFFSSGSKMDAVILIL